MSDVTLHLGDCLDVLPTLAAGSVDAVVTDPPYPNNGGHFEDAVGTARRVLHNTKTQCLVFWSPVEKPPVDLPLIAVHICTYNNVNGRPYEAIYHFHPDGVRRRSDVFHYWMIKQGIGPADKEYAGHPTQKPIAFMAWCIENFTNPGDTVLDPFMGSGTTGVACMKLGRNFIGIERDPGYFAIAQRRIAAAQAQLVLPLFSGGRVR